MQEGRKKEREERKKGRKEGRKDEIMYPRAKYYISLLETSGLFNVSRHVYM